MVASGERRLRMLVIHARHQAGFYVAMAPADLSPEQIESALNELGIDGDEVLKIGGWVEDFE